MPWWLSAQKQEESGCGGITCQLSTPQHVRAGAWLTNSPWYLTYPCTGCSSCGMFGTAGWQGCALDKASVSGNTDSNELL